MASKFSFSGAIEKINEMQARRVAICNACPHLQPKENGNDRCGLCGCPVKDKAIIPMFHCPDKRW